MSTIHQSVESARGCGYRKAGGMYLIGGHFSSHCGKLPIQLHSCPCCGQGVKFRRGFSWIGYELIASVPCTTEGCVGCDPFNDSFLGKKLGLLFCGEKFYKTPEDFMKEARQMGISKRISAVPKELVVGETWVLLAHNKAISKLVYVENPSDNPEAVSGIVQYPGIFAAFIPTHIEYVVKGDETEDELEKLEKRGFTLVNVIPQEEAQMAIDQGESGGVY